MTAYTARAYQVGAAWVVEATETDAPMIAISLMLAPALEDLRKQLADMAGVPASSVRIRLVFTDGEGTEQAR